MEWEAPGIILDLRPLGEADCVATVMTEEHGAHRGLARGAQSRTRAALWQKGNLVQLRWIGRLSDQLGSLSAEMVHPTASTVMDDRLLLSMLTSACAVAEGALIEREPQPVVFDGLLHLLARLPVGETMLADLIRWELSLLTALGYGLDLSVCAVTGEATDLAGISPRTGRAVSVAAAGVWRDRLLPLPKFLISNQGGDIGQYAQGLRLTGHFLARDAFGHHHRPLPPPRQTLYDHVSALAQELDAHE
jgi:DNA repair protein RecO (recombination protein O)